MIKLENVSKYYHSEGVVTLGLRKVTLEFKIGEFVAITGESGSGKSTLLNVISGIDTYEEGEMYINGEETSHYDEEGWENYRKNKVAFIFQNYNLIDSYTVLKNVEVALLNQGYDLKARRSKAKEILKRVGLGRHLRHRASKLSGGEKQRLAIARALAKNSDIIVADEPTGNLDSESGRQVLALLNEVAGDKLVLVVTHNYEQAKDYVTRKIRLFDGEVVEDREIKPFVPKKPKEYPPAKMAEWKKSAVVAFYNIFGQPRKSLLLFLVSCATVFFVFLLFGSLLSVGDSVDRGWIPIETYNVYPERVFVIRKDHGPLTESDYEKLSRISKVKRVIKEDAVMDLSFYLRDPDLTDIIQFGGLPSFLDEYDPENLIGRFPEADDEVLLCTYVHEDDIELLRKRLNKPYEFDIYKYSSYDGFFLNINKEYKIAGIYNRPDSRNNIVLSAGEMRNLYDRIRTHNKRFAVRIEYSGEIVAGLELSNVLPDVNLTGNQISTTLLSNYLEGYTIKWGDEVLEPIPADGAKHYVVTYVSPELLEKIFPLEYPQYSLELTKASYARDVLDKLYREGYYGFCPYLYQSRFNFTFDYLILRVLLTVALGFSLMVVYLLSYLIFRGILNSKVQDYTILRIIGYQNKNIKQIILMEVFFSFLFAYLAFVMINWYLGGIKLMETYEIRDYLLIGLINLLLAGLITRKFIRYQKGKSLFAALKIGG